MSASVNGNKESFTLTLVDGERNCQKGVWEFRKETSQCLSFVPPTGRVWHKGFFRWVRCKAIVQTYLSASKMTRSPSAFPPKRAPEAPDGKPSPFKKVQSLGDGSRGSRMPVKAHLDRLTGEPGHTRSDPLYRQTRTIEVCPSPGLGGGGRTS